MKVWLIIVSLLFGLIACKDAVVDVGNPDNSGNQQPSAIGYKPDAMPPEPTPTPTPTPDFQKNSENNWDEEVTEDSSSEV